MARRIGSEMLVDTLVVSNMYRDSVSLMRISSNICDRPGIAQAYCLMATQTNLDLLRDTRLLSQGVNAGANDILIVVEARDRESLDQALVAAKAALEAKHGQSELDIKKNIVSSQYYILRLLLKVYYYIRSRRSSNRIIF